MAEILEEVHELINLAGALQAASLRAGKHHMKRAIMSPLHHLQVGNVARKGA